MDLYCALSQFQCVLKIDANKAEEPPLLPMVRQSKKNHKKDDIIRLASRGFSIDLSVQNAELVPLGLLRRMYPIVLWKCGRSAHGMVAIREILNEQPLNASSHAIYGALLYQIGR
eukprot:220005_1